MRELATRMWLCHGCCGPRFPPFPFIPSPLPFCCHESRSTSTNHDHRPRSLPQAFTLSPFLFNLPNQSNQLNQQTSFGLYPLSPSRTRTTNTLHDPLHESRHTNTLHDLSWHTHCSLPVVIHQDAESRPPIAERLALNQLTQFN